MNRNQQDEKVAGGMRERKKESAGAGTSMVCTENDELLSVTKDHVRNKW